jgi:hypothetical protein
MSKQSKYKWDRVEPKAYPISEEEMEQLDRAYSEWKDELDKAIIQGDQTKIDEILEMGK